MQTPNTFAPMRTTRSAKHAATQSVQDSTYRALKSLVNMYGVDLSVHSY